jgi:CheY-like chemotaxis protein
MGQFSMEIYAPTGSLLSGNLQPEASLIDLKVIADAASPALSKGNGTRPMPEHPRLLVVEDSFLVLLTIEGMCQDLGWEVVGPATRLDKAMALARTETFDAALLDVNLDGDMSWPVADVLNKRGIPFAFTTGYDQSNMLPDIHAGSEIIAKPYHIEDLANRLREMMKRER